jgi:hypothetical protein
MHIKANEIQAIAKNASGKHAYLTGVHLYTLVNLFCLPQLLKKWEKEKAGNAISHLSWL